jgi:hypothetical protein
MKKMFFCATALLLFVAQLSYAEKWQAVGARAMAMGGAGVAAATGSAQQYYNPALLATESKLHNNDVILNVNVGFEATEKLLVAANKIKDLTDKYRDVENAINSNSKATADEMKSIVETLSALKDLNLNNTGVVVSANTGLATKIKKFVVSVRSYVSAGITPIVDTQNINLGRDGKGLQLSANTTAPTESQNRQAAITIQSILDKHNLTDSLNALFGKKYSSDQLANALVNMAVEMGSNINQITEMADTIVKELPNATTILNNAKTGGSYKDNKTQVLVDAGAFTEVAIGYGYEVHKGIQVGGNLKFINGQMAETGIMIMSDNKKMEKVIEDAFKERKSTNNFGIDLGALLDFSKFFETDILFKPTVGVVVRNINNPAFDRPNKPVNADERLQWNSSSYNLNRQYRAGAAIKPLNWLTVAADMDLVKNKTMVNGFDSQDFALGVELNLINKTSFSIPLRAGLNKNIANSNSALEYTAGFGFCGTGFCLELACGVSTKTTKIDGNKIPANAAVALNLGVLF